MNVTYFSPMEIGKGMVCGAVLESEVMGTQAAEFIPTSLPIMPLAEVHERGGLWLLTHLPESFVVFPTHQLAVEFLAGMWVANQVNMMTPELVEDLANFLGGEWHDKAEYGYEVTPRHNLN